MGDIDDAAPLRLQFADDAEQRFGFGIGQRIGRFIHNDDFRFKAQHFGDLHHLLIANRQIAHQLLAVKAEIQLCQQLVGFGIHLLPVDFAKTVNKFATKEDVLGNRQLRDQVQFLVDDTDPGFLGGFGAVKGRLFA